MTVLEKDLDKIKQLAYLEIEDSSKLTFEINAVMNFVDTLRLVDTTHIEPLFHPMALHQRLRPDEVTEKDCSAELASIAPAFKDSLYWVPKVDLDK